MKKINVAVMMGGRSEERNVSLSTGRMIMNALDREKYNAFPVDPACLDASALPSGTKALPGSSETGFELMPLESNVRRNGHTRPDVVFIALHGRLGEDGTVQGMLELLGIPYVGSGVLASALAMDKIVAGKLLAAEGIPMPRSITVSKTSDLDVLPELVAKELGYPVVAKPNRQGSSVGLSIVKEYAELLDAVRAGLQFDSDVLIEEFVKGVEITVPVLGNDELEVLPVVEIVPKSGVYDYSSKYDMGATEEIVPARIPEAQYHRAQELGLQCHRALGCRGMSRTDMIVRGEDVYVLEINTIPGMTPTSLLPTSAAAAGIEFPKLLDRLIGYALED